MTDYAYTDIDINLARQKDGDIQLLIDLEAIKVNIMNIVRTMQGSRRMKPNFCFGPSDFLFEQMTQNSAINIGNAILSSIKEYEDRVDITNVNVEGNLSTGFYNITISYKLKAYGATNDVFTLSFILKKL